jgi:hypothetical protein
MIINGSLNRLFPLHPPSDNWLPEFLSTYRISWFNFEKPLMTKGGFETTIGGMYQVNSDLDPELAKYKCIM